jgi:hypothetical protein
VGRVGRGGAAVNMGAEIQVEEISFQEL